MANTAQSAEHSPDERTPAVWWTTAGMIPVHIPPPATKPPTPPMGGRRGFMLALCGLAAMLTLGAAGPAPPPDQFPFAAFIARAGLKCPELPAEAPVPPPRAPVPPPPVPEPLPVIPASPPSPAPPKIKKPTKPADAFTRKAKKLQSGPIARKCAKFVAPGQTVKVRVDHQIDAGNAKASIEDPIRKELKICVKTQVQSAKRWPNEPSKSRFFHYLVKGPPAR